MPMYNDLAFPLCNLPLPALTRVEDLDLADGLQPLLAGLAALLRSLLESRRHLSPTEVGAALELLGGQADLRALIVQRWCAHKFPVPARRGKEPIDEP